MRSLYLRIWLTVLAALALFALVSGWLVQRHLSQERARLEAAHTRWLDVDTHAALDYAGAQMLMVAQYPPGGGPSALESGGVKQDREAMAEEAGPEVAAALADLVAEDERALKEDARAHGDQRTHAGRPRKAESGFPR